MAHWRPLRLRLVKSTDEDMPSTDKTAPLARPLNPPTSTSGASSACQMRRARSVRVHSVYKAFRTCEARPVPIEPYSSISTGETNLLGRRMAELACAPYGTSSKTGPSCQAHTFKGMYVIVSSASACLILASEYWVS